MPQNLKKSGRLEQTAILSGGDPFSPGLTVSPGVFSVLNGMLGVDDIRQRSSLTNETSGRRREFAAWLTNPARNPLTPRVMVNRLWQHHFGQGLVATANNFGTAGAKPSHPALLEYLATELVRQRWSAKEIHRLILTSEAYCRAQSADVAFSQERSEFEQQLREKDPNGISYATYSARRLSAEEIRDTVLAVSGLLNTEIGGAPICPDINQEVATQPRQIMGTYAPIYQPSPHPADRNRRTLYALRLRGLRDPMLEVFNQPSPDLPCEKRDSSTVAPQALTLFNSSMSYVRALAMAERLQHEIPSEDRQLVVARAFQLAYGRQPSIDEAAACLAHWSSMTQRHRSVHLDDMLPPVQVTRTFVDENTGEQFSYTEELEQNRDYQPETWPSHADPATRGLADLCLVLLASNEMLYVP